MAQVGKIKMHNWDEWQTYRKDRGTPPWIKVHRNIMSNPKWAALSDKEKGQLISMWVVAADNSGELPADANIIRKICVLDDSPDLDKFQRLSWVDCQDGVKMTSYGCQSDAPETETETDTDKKVEEDTPTALPDFSPVSAEEADRIMGKYCFEGKIIRLTRKQRDIWDKAFPFINVIEHIASLDDHYAVLDARGETVKGKWFFRCEKALQKANNTAKEIRGGLQI